VQPGDYLAKLAQQWGVNWIDIATLNNIQYPYIIYVGQVLKKPGSSTPSTPGQPPIPTATPVPNSGQTYIVQPGDYLAKLAQQWGVSWQQIAALNNISYPYIIYVGQVLKKP
jgi:lysozyme